MAELRRTVLLASLSCLVRAALLPPAPLAVTRPAAAAALPPLRRASALRLSAPAEDVQEVVSPFGAEGGGGEGEETITGTLPLTMENVDRVLDEMRPYLIADGGNVAVKDIDGGVVQLELQGACGSCPSSTMTMKMGLERGLREKIPEIVDVVQVAPEGPVLDEAGVEEVLEQIRPFLAMAGGKVELLRLDAAGVMPTAHLEISGSGSTINSVRVEIAQRLKRNFPTLGNVTWE